MELTSKQRAQLRGMAANLDTIVHVGKDGIGENLIKQVNDALEARELVKGRVLENSMLHRPGSGRGAEGGRPLRGGAGHRQQICPFPLSAQQGQAEDRAGKRRGRRSV